MKEHTLSNSKLKYISDSLFERLKQYTISKNDLYLTIAGTIGDVGIVPSQFDGMILTENAVKLAYLQAYKYFLLYSILSPFIQGQFVDKTKQMAQPKLAIERIKTTMIPLPPSPSENSRFQRDFDLI
jgi:type I restriction enzyme S subunit